MKKKSNKNLVKKAIHELMDIENYNPHIKIVKVCWKDANTNSSELWLRDIPKQKLLPVETIGYLLYEDEKVLIVSGMAFWDETTDFLDEKGTSVFKNVHTIPKSQVDMVLVLKIDFEATKKLKGEQEDDNKSN